MTKNYPFSEIQEKLANSQKILIALPKELTYDKVSAALSLFLSLQLSGKEVTVVSPQPMTVEYSDLVGVDKISQKIKGTDLVVSFNYQMENIEKISYNDDGGKLNLVLQPKSNSPSINEKAVSFSFSGTDFNLIVAVGAKNLEQLDASGLGQINVENVINIDIRPDNANYAFINVLDVDASSYSEAIWGLIEGLGWSSDIDIAQNLLKGIWKATSGLRKPDLQADTYEAVASFLRLGAQKPIENQPLKTERNFPQKHEQKVWQQNQPVRKPAVLPTEVKEEPKNPPADWLEPKIYKSSGNI